MKITPLEKAKRAPTYRLGDLQLRIMTILWDRGEASVSDVLQGLGDTAKLAYTTVATMLRKMEARELVTHREEGRTFIYSANVAAEAVSRSMIDYLVDRLFAGSLTQAVNHLLRTREVSRKELDALERLIRERKQKP